MYSGKWYEHHPNPRISYYLFLRRIYGMTAVEARDYMKRIGAW